MQGRRIIIDPKIRFGKPVLEGTRIAVIDILNLLAAGYKTEEIPKQYPNLTKKDVLKVLNFAINLIEKPQKANSLIYQQA